MKKPDVHEGWEEKNMGKLLISYTNSGDKFNLSNPYPPTIFFFTMEWVEVALHSDLLT